MVIKTKRRLKSLLKYLVLTCFLVLTILPFMWVLLISLEEPQGEIHAFPVRYPPNSASTVNYTAVLWEGSLGWYMPSSFSSSTVAATCAVPIVILVSYAMSRFHSRFKNVLLLSPLVTQMIPMFIMLAPLYQLLAKAKVFNDLRSLVIPYTNIMAPFSVATLRDFFGGVPKSLEEAAWINGCDCFKALFKVVVLATTPGIAATSIFAPINFWNELSIAVIFIDANKFKIIPVGLNGLILKYDIKWGEMATGIIISLVSTICPFAFAQKYMIEGFTAGLVKG